MLRVSNNAQSAAKLLAPQEQEVISMKPFYFGGLTPIYNIIVQRIKAYITNINYIKLEKCASRMFNDYPRKGREIRH